MQVTISLLPVSLSLLHIPRSRLPSLSASVIRQILQPNPTFLNLTCNEIELSVFADAQSLVEFESIARHDRQRQRSRSGSGSSRSRKILSDAHVHEPIEISYEKWNVLQIDSHSDPIDDAGARVNELSAPLAAAGISILYQSSYMSDFIFVKESRLQEAMALFSEAGFDLYSIQENSLTNSLLSPPLSPLADPHDAADLPPFTTSPGAVLTRTRSTTDTGSLSSSMIFSENASGTQTPSRTKSHSPTSGDVHILTPDLICVGLSDESVEHWSLKIIKLIAYPDLIPIPDTSKNAVSKSSQRRTFTNSLYNVLSTTPRSHTRVRSGSVDSAQYESSSSLTDDEDDLEEDGYFSHSPTSHNHSTSSLTSVTSSHSCSDIAKNTPGVTAPAQPPLASASSHRLYSKHLMGMGGPLSPLSPINTLPSTTFVPFTTVSRSFSRSVSTSSRSTSEHSNNVSRPNLRVPFFSITRTSEGSSLTTEAELLALLFPPNDRYMVICGEELDAAYERLTRKLNGDDEENDVGKESEGRSELSGRSSGSVDGEEDVEEDDNAECNTLKCLQIDLRRFGLDKHGLVNRFSRVLDENGINHLYSSTVKTANLLVGKKHAVRAQTLLKAC